MRDGLERLSGMGAAMVPKRYQKRASSLGDVNPGPVTRLRTHESQAERAAVELARLFQSPLLTHASAMTACRMQLPWSVLVE